MQSMVRMLHSTGDAADGTRHRVAVKAGCDDADSNSLNCCSWQDAPLHVNYACVRVCILVFMTACGLPASLLHQACIELLAPLPML